MPKIAALFIFTLLLLSSLAPIPSPIHAQNAYIRSPRLGITFISSIDHPASDHRYDRALLLGAGWNRWPLYWDRVERSPGVFDWNAYDRLVNDDVRHGLQVNAILLGRPAFHAQGGGIVGLNNPIFTDGTDTPGAGKVPNPANPWAVFTYQAVQRYRPGGLLAAQLGWPADWGISVWEAWNEPDLTMFWSASLEDYARLLKITYLVVHTVDPNAKVMFGGLAYGNPDQDDWLAKVLAIFANDPTRTAYNWFMDIVGIHSYSYPRRTYLIIRRARENLARYGLSRPIWLNESGVPVWDDYPGPTWTRNEPASRVLRATMNQQAAYVVENTVYAWAAGAEVVFFHQLYDDCGNQPGGTDFPPHNGELCTGGALCAGDAHGLYRNDRGEACFSQHPLPGTPRPSAAAFYRLAQIFGTIPFENPQIQDPDGGGVLISFDRPSTGERIVVMWNRVLAGEKLDIPAMGNQAELYSIDNQDWELSPTDGKYEIGLPAATRDDYPYLPAGQISAIGGSPLIMIERVEPGRINPALPQFGDAPISEPIPAIGPASTPIPRPTVDPAFDTTPPVPNMTPLATASPASFMVNWSATDDSGIDHYLIWVRVDSGNWSPWLETSETQAEYSGVPGSTYEFAVWAVDLAGNWSLNTELTPQAITRVE